ncbi:uncharacterized protein itprid1 isoform X2 [Parambassis ranga]|uniref:Uncharacterized protein itprid1 isoform X2 n=1 Tax=Parambassis ranga TaxID=210632 RepID=A0A6P7KIE7_9TELE|nr:protein ITPRID1 isoform X2 [Parambassis ranga]
MDILNLWNDDPEELLLDLGFGSDEPDLSGRIPARFINHQSQARGINLQVFLEAQKNRLDLENPDVSNRFRQLEVLQQVTTAFSCLVGSPSTPLRTKLVKDLSAESRERRRRVGMLFRRASKKSLNRKHHQHVNPPAAPDSLQPTLSLTDKNGPLDTECLSPVAEEQGTGPEQSMPYFTSLITQEGALRSGPLKEIYQPANSFSQRKKSLGQAKESFEIEEIHSFDEGSYIGTTDNSVSSVIRTNSCQSDSSGFLEEPFIPSVPQLASPAGPDLIKALSGLSGGCSDSHGNDGPGSCPHTTQPSLLPTPLTSSVVAEDLTSSNSPSPDPSAVFGPSISPASPDSVPANQNRSQPTPPLSSSLMSSSTQPGSLIKEYEEIDVRPTHLSTLEGCSRQSVTHSDSSPSPNLGGRFYAPPAMSSSSSSVACHMSVESISQSPENKDQHFSDFDEMGLSDASSNNPEKQDERPMSPTHLLDNSSPPSSPVLDSCALDVDPTTPAFLSTNITSVPVWQSAMLSNSSLIDPAVGRISVLTEQFITEKDKQQCHDDDNTDPVPASPIHGVCHVDYISVGLEDIEVTDASQTADDIVYILDRESPAGLTQRSEPEIDTWVPHCELHGELSGKTKEEGLRNVSQMMNLEVSGTESESVGRYLVVHDEDQEQPGGTEVKPKGLIEIESLDLVFETSVDGSDGENYDADAFFQRLDAEGHVYWAEPLILSNTTTEESGSFDSSDGSPTGPAAQDSSSSTGKPMTSLFSTDTDHTPGNAASDKSSCLSTPSATSITKPSGRSVSVQMSSLLSSHIVHRKDVPYIAHEPKPTLLTTILPLDTSTPFRAVQSWTDQQIQRNTLNNKLTHDPHTVPDHVTESRSAQERPTAISSSSLSFSNKWQPHDFIPEMAVTDKDTLEAGLWCDKQVEVDRSGHEYEQNLWDGYQPGTMTCCCSCDHQCACCSHNKEHKTRSFPYSLDELEEMMLCVRQFRSVLSNMEEQLSEDQAAVYSSLSDKDREVVQDIEELRDAVKKEVGQLEMQLNELAHHYDESLKMKMHRLLDEQSSLCSQLRVFLPGMVPNSLTTVPNKTVATQCCLLPWLPPPGVPGDHVATWSTQSMDSTGTPDSGNIYNDQSASPLKTEKLDVVGFLQRLKQSLHHHSAKTDSME